MNLLRNGIRWLSGYQIRFCSDVVTYLHQGTEYQVNAIRGRVSMDGEDMSPVTLRVRRSDFLIPAEELPLTPEPGDRIHADHSVFEVLDLMGTGCWE